MQSPFLNEEIMKFLSRLMNLPGRPIDPERHRLIQQIIQNESRWQKADDLSSAGHHGIRTQFIWKRGAVPRNKAPLRSQAEAAAKINCLPL